MEGHHHGRQEQEQEYDAPRHVEQDIQRINHVQCTSCGLTYEYPGHRDPRDVHETLRMHAVACRNRSPIASVSTSPATTEAETDISRGPSEGQSEGLSQTSSGDLGSMPAQEAMTGPIRVPKKRGPKRSTNEIKRREQLESDEWATDVMPTSVKCDACKRTIKLDKRSTYYPGLWDKHKRSCQEIKRLIALRKQEARFARIARDQMHERVENSLPPPKMGPISGSRDVGTSSAVQAHNSSAMKANAYRLNPAGGPSSSQVMSARQSWNFRPSYRAQTYSHDDSYSRYTYPPGSSSHLSNPQPAVSEPGPSSRRLSSSNRWIPHSSHDEDDEDDEQDDEAERELFYNRTYVERTVERPPVEDDRKKKGKERAIPNEDEFLRDDSDDLDDFESHSN